MALRAQGRKDLGVRALPVLALGELVRGPAEGVGLLWVRTGFDQQTHCLRVVAPHGEVQRVAGPEPVPAAVHAPEALPLEEGLHLGPGLRPLDPPPVLAAAAAALHTARGRGTTLFGGGLRRRWALLLAPMGVGGESLRLHARALLHAELRQRALQIAAAPPLRLLLGLRRSLCHGGLSQGVDSGVLRQVNRLVRLLLAARRQAARRVRAAQERRQRPLVGHDDRRRPLPHVLRSARTCGGRLRAAAALGGDLRAHGLLLGAGGGLEARAGAGTALV
mmetsp:Transcript_109722/g.341976  ORF Transcript_109722/g.341976 Transcript_109722/m.341976 type:complete len:277 (+) Transcript_109722:111-941(+)